MKRLMLFVLCLSLAISQTFAQATRTVTGKVTDAQGNPVVAAAVQVKGTKVGTTTGSDGSFSLSVPSNATVLIISSVSFKEQEVNIAGQSNVTVQLTDAAGTLDEVVVTVPYGTIKKTAFTGSEATITNKQIEKQQVTSVTRAIEGLAPGVLTTNGGGAPGTGATIVLRGFNSINLNQAPLYVLNGVPYDGTLVGIATEDIETVTLLKDAAASALYGSRAANGVIMITTKTGKKGKPQINARVSQGFMSRGIPEYDRVSPSEYYELMWEATRNSFQYGQNIPAAQAGALASQQLTDANHLVYNAYNVPGNQLINPATGKINPNAQLLWNDSWEDALFRTAARTNANVNIAGAGDKSDYYLSLGYVKEEGIMKFTDYQRYNFRANLNTNPATWFKTGLNIDGSYATRNDVIGTGAFTSNPFYYSRNMGPIYPIWQRNPTTGAFVLDAAGERVLDWGVPTQMGARPIMGNSNLLGSLELDENSTRRINANINPYVEIKFLKDFTFRTNFGLNVLEDNATLYQNNQFGDAQNVQGRSTKGFDRQLSYTLNQVLSWGKTFGNHEVRALAGHEFYKYKYWAMSATRIGFQFPNVTELTSATQEEGPATSQEDMQTLESYFGNVNYSYNDKYLASLSVRTDGSSRFAPSVRWGTFYSAGLGWVVSNEDFMKNVTWINNMKLRASYGETGQQDLGATQQRLYPYVDWYYADGVGGYSQIAGRVANPDLVWEKNVKFNVGVDFTMFKNRLQGTVEYFRNTSSDLIFDVPLPLSTGNQFVLQNVGASRNAGIELQLGYNAIRKRNFDWRIDFNITHFKNRITKLPKIYQDRGGFTSGTKRIAVGSDIFAFFLVEYAGVDAATGDALFYRNILGTDGKPTGERVLTNNINTVSNNDHKKFFGSAIPDFNGGLTNSFRYKNFDLSVLLTYSYGGQFYDANYAGLMHEGIYGNHWHKDILQRWQKPGDVTNVPRIQNGVANQQGVTSQFLFDASYLNVKNITLTYNIPQSVANRLHLNKVSVYGSVDNAYLFTAKKGMDPQRAFNGTSDASYPPFRTVTLGLNVNL